MAQLIGRGIRDLHELLKSKQVSALELLQEHLTHIKSHDAGKVEAFICLTEDLAAKQARQVDEQIARGETISLLSGIPVAVKDNMCVPGYATTCASKILENFTPSYTCTAVDKLFKNGAVCVGKTNLDEFAMGSSTENSSVKRTVNPWNGEYVPGGSSGGSAAAVAAGFAVTALGSDTGGSIRQPASFCGVAGMKPTYGVVSRFGMVAFASSLDQIGPFARSVEDTAITLNAILGHDPQDSTSLPNLDALYQGSADRDLTINLSKSSADLVKGMRIGLIKELIGAGIDPDVRSAVLSAASLLEHLGAKVEEVSVPTAKYALPVYYIIATAEASANLARYDGVRYGLRAQADDIGSMYTRTRQEGFGEEVKRRIMLGTYALSSGYYDAYYKKAQQVRRLLTQDFERIFQSVGCVICPTSPSQPFKFGEKTGDPLTMYLSDIATIPANLAGLPGISVPAGFGKDGLPIGLQIMGAALSDRTVLEVAQAFQKATDFSLRQTPLLAS